MFKTHDRQIDPLELARDLRFVVWGAWLVLAGIPLAILAVGIALGALGAILLAIGYFKCRRASTWGLLSHLLLVNVLPIAFALYYFDDDWLPLVLAWFQLSALASSFPFLKLMRRVSNKLVKPTPSAKFYAVAAAIVLAVSAGAYIQHFSQPGSPSDRGGDLAGVIVAAFVLLICLPVLAWFAWLVTRFRKSIAAVQPS
jgi:hypothetical protein